MKGLVEMKNVKDKIIITAAVGFTAASTITPQNVTNVFAEELKNTEVVNVDVVAPKTKKEKLENSVKNAKSNLDDLKKIADEKKADVDEAKKALDEVTSSQMEQQKIVDSQYAASYDKVDKAYQELLGQITELENEYAAKKEALEKYKTTESEASENLKKAQDNLKEKQAKLDEVKSQLEKYDVEKLEKDLEVANEEKNKAQDAYDKAFNESKNAAAELEQANSELSAKKSEMDNAQTAYNSASSLVAEKQAAYEAAKKNHEDLVQDTDEIKEQIQQTENDLAAAKQAEIEANNNYFAALKEYNEASDIYEEKNQIIN